MIVKRKRKSKKHPIELQLEREGLGEEREAGGLRSTETETLYPEDNGVLHDAETDFLHDHPFANEMERRLWELHACDRMSLEDITATLKAEGYTIYRKKVQQIVYRFKEMVKGRAMGQRRRGRPLDTWSRGKFAKHIRFRLNYQELQALEKVESALKVKYKSLSGLIRALIVSVAEKL